MPGLSHCTTLSIWPDTQAMAHCGRPRHPARREKMTSVKQTRAGAVGLLTLNDPASLNAMTPELLGGLAAAIGEMTSDLTLRALVLTGEGRGFCSGQTLKASESLGNDIVAGVMRHYWPPGAARVPRAGRRCGQRSCGRRR